MLGCATPTQSTLPVVGTFRTQDPTRWFELRLMPQRRFAWETHWHMPLVVPIVWTVEGAWRIENEQVLLDADDEFVGHGAVRELTESFAIIRDERGLALESPSCTFWSIGG